MIMIISEEYQAILWLESVHPSSLRDHESKQSQQNMKGSEVLSDL